MRITFVLPYAGMSGGNRVLAIYADRLHRRGHTVSVISCPLPKRHLIRKIAAMVRGRGWPQNLVPEPSYFDSIDVPHHVIDQWRPVVDADVPDADIVLATFWLTGPWVAKMSLRKGAKAILLQGHEISPGEENPEMDAVWRLPLRKIVISKWLVDLARDRFGDSNVYDVPNSVDTAQFHAPARGKQHVPTVGMLYAPSQSKGMDINVEALELVRRQIANLRVVAFGAHRVSKEFPLPEWVEFHHRPPQDEIRNLYAACDTWLCCSRREGFGLPLIEAMACRCPVVSTRCGGPQDFVQEGINGYLTDIDDSATLAERTIRILTLDERAWKTMSESALATAASYTWDDATDRLESALQDIVESSSHRS